MGKCCLFPANGRMKEGNALHGDGEPGDLVPGAGMLSKISTEGVRDLPPIPGNAGA